MAEKYTVVRKFNREGKMTPRTCSQCNQEFMTNVIDEPYICGDCWGIESGGEVGAVEDRVQKVRQDWSWRLYQHLGYRVAEDDEQTAALNAAIESIIENEIEDRRKKSQVVGVIHTDHLNDEWGSVLDELAGRGLDDKVVLLKEEIAIKFKNNKSGTPTKWISKEDRSDSLDLLMSLQKWSESRYMVVIEPHTVGKNIDLGLDFSKSFKTEDRARKEYDALKASLLDGDFTCVMMDYRIYFDWPGDKANRSEGLDGYGEAFKIEQNTIQPLLDRYPPEEYPKPWMTLARTVRSGLEIIEQFCIRCLSNKEAKTDKNLFVDSNPFGDIKCEKCGQPIKKWVFHVCEKKAS